MVPRRCVCHSREGRPGRGRIPVRGIDSRQPFFQRDTFAERDATLSVPEQGGGVGFLATRHGFQGSPGPSPKGEPMSREYDFRIRYQCPDGAADVDTVVERLGEAGCDDALVGVGVPGRVALQFSREADSAEAAVVSAIRDVRRALPEARLVEVEPDLVGLTEVAELVGVSRQNMRQFIKRHPGSFPPTRT